ncbi:hypothetical protein T459_11547 [Capsicum annuum]|uniref:Uncharacterized protein n=1 Tax=Capsicum annuum TaxID=4072 RepID=A0A2G2ZMG8_CAPAN|nr:Ethylene-responsive transcription factor 11 [Capsicum annuum]PHT83104.1 hypothetical protein T459_11547 [Capsicum annuum]
MVSKRQKCRKAKSRVEKVNGGVAKAAEKVKRVVEKMHYRGVQKRLSRKYTKETRDLRKISNVCLGTFDMTEEAQTCDTTMIEFYCMKAKAVEVEAKATVMVESPPHSMTQQY